MKTLKVFINCLFFVFLIFAWVFLIVPYTKYLWGSLLCGLIEGWIMLLGVNIVPKYLIYKTPEERRSFPVVNVKYASCASLFFAALGVIGYFAIN